MSQILITYLKTLPKNLLAVYPENWTRKKKRNKKTRMAIAKLFALNANVKKVLKVNRPAYIANHHTNFPNGAILLLVWKRC